MNCILILFILLIIIIIFAQKYTPEYFTQKQVERMYKFLPLEYYYSDYNYLQTLIKISSIVINILNKHNIRYWATFGTLLGTKRHNGIIPWDDDIDIAFVEEDTPKLFALKDEFKKHGLILYCVSSEKRLVYKIRFINNDPKLKSAWVDLFPFYYNKVDKHWHRVRGNYKKIKQDDLFPLKKATFHNDKINIPYNENQVLNDLFGPDWDKNVVVSIHQKVYNKHKYIRTHNNKIPLENRETHQWNGNKLNLSSKI